MFVAIRLIIKMVTNAIKSYKNHYKKELINWLTD